ncbi:MAG TPA: phosphoribosylamine--glycine ligase [Burkholderiaceae bacterium]|nr:phosphoribosylamine--glycine ligase [Burkholderiaceae bacterium]
MKVLVIGSGAREHALAWKLLQSPKVTQVVVAPGNGGTATEPGVVNLAEVDLVALADYAAAQDIALTVVGPEAPLAAGVVDLFRSRGLRIFGPTHGAAQLESSKAFAKDFMRRHGIPTAHYAVFDDAVAAHAHVEAHGAPIVVKADGLAAGKGVVVAATAAEAHAAIDYMLSDNAGVAHNAGQAQVVIEEFMAGEEASFIVVADGRHALALATSQDHKRIGDGDTGPNTGGMGAYSPAPVVTPDVHARVMREIIDPTIAGMAAEGHPFSGFLYAGLMIDANGRPRVVEFNARLGDPEAQVLLMRLKSDLFELLMAATEPHGSGVRDLELQWDRRSALGVVMAAAGYPGTPRKGDPVTGLPPPTEDMHVFHAGTVREAGGAVATSGGRVLTVAALGEPLRTAQQRAYEALASIRFDGAQFRHDIGHRALGRR